MQCGGARRNLVSDLERGQRRFDGNTQFESGQTIYVNREWILAICTESIAVSGDHFERSHIKDEFISVEARFQAMPVKNDEANIPVTTKCRMQYLWSGLFQTNEGFASLASS